MEIERVWERESSKINDDELGRRSAAPETLSVYPSCINNFFCKPHTNDFFSPFFSFLILADSSKGSLVRKRKREAQIHALWAQKRGLAANVDNQALKLSLDLFELMIQIHLISYNL